MNIMKEYTLEHIIKNKHSSIAIMIAILIASTLLCSLCVMEYNLWYDEVKLVIEKEGNWHGELFEDTSGEKLKYVIGHSNVENVMIKGQWNLAQISGDKRPYLIMRDANKDYWSYMPEKNSILEGRVPQKTGELVVSKQFLEVNPQILLGDTLTLPVGVRMNRSEILDPRSAIQVGEQFSAAGKKNYTIVGILDATTSSVTPGYYAMGYLEHENIQPNDKLTVYIRLKNSRTVYKDLPQIAQSVGFTPDEYGNYPVKYHARLLSKCFIFPKIEAEEIKLSDFAVPLLDLVIAALVVGVFVLIIHNAFTLSANARIKHLGMLKSLGATPKQISRSVTFEAMLLSVIPIPIGVALGYGMCNLLLLKINEVTSISDQYSFIQFEYGWPVVIPAILLTLLTIWLSASIPARRISKMLPIDAIRQSGEPKLKKAGKHPFITRILGFEGELAINSLSANRKAFRTSIISLTLSFLLLCVFLNLLSIAQVSNRIYEAKQDYNISLSIRDGKQVDKEFFQQIRSIPSIITCTFRNSITGTAWVTKEQESHAIKEIGGFSQIADRGKYPVLERDGKYRIQISLIALDDKAFADYCQSIGTNPLDYYDIEHPKSIVINTTLDTVNNTRRNPVWIPLLNITAGNILTISEKTEDNTPGDFIFPLQAGFVTDQFPRTINRFNYYRLAQVMPMSVYQNIVKHFDSERIPRCLYTAIDIQVSEENVPAVMEQLKKICNRWYGSGDYQYYNAIEEQEALGIYQITLKIIIYCVSVLFALVGIANAFATVTGSLQQRRREFAMLRSVGLSPKSMKKMLLLEALFFGINPLLRGIPIIGVCIIIFLKLNEVYWYEFLPNMPLLPIFIFVLLILSSIGIAYLLGAKKIKLDTIAAAIKDETI